MSVIDSWFSRNQFFTIEHLYDLVPAESVILFAYRSSTLVCLRIIIFNFGVIRGRLSMKCMLAFIISATLVLPCVASPPSSGRESKQAQLDAACESAREHKLAPERAKYVEECVRDKFKDSREACERFYRDYGSETADRLALYYDLPECVQAFEFRQSYRQ
jgi:hypothetical protein